MPHKDKGKKEPGKGLKINKRQKSNFKKFQEGFRSKFGIKKKALSLAFVICIWMCCSGIAVAQDATLPGKITVAWNTNTEQDLAGYKIYVGTASKGYDKVIDVGNKTYFTVDDLKVGDRYYLAVTAYDTSNNESGFSNELTSVPKDGDPPSNPTGLIEVESLNIKANTVNIIENG